MIEIKKVSKKFGNFTAVDQVSLTISRPGITVLMGPSASGKTTLLRLIAGLEDPDQGEIRMDKQLVSGKGVKVQPNKRGIGFVFQQPALWPHMRVAENILFGLAGLSREEQQQRLRETLALVDLEQKKNSFPHQLSGGQQRLAAIARALAVQPQYLLMDEPLANLDKAGRETMLRFIKELGADQARYIFYVTHDPVEADFLGGPIAKMREGKIVADE